jgi:hypothetical protein
MLCAEVWLTTISRRLEWWADYYIIQSGYVNQMKCIGRSSFLSRWTYFLFIVITSCWIQLSPVDWTGSQLRSSTRLLWQRDESSNHDSTRSRAHPAALSRIHTVQCRLTRLTFGGWNAVLRRWRVQPPTSNHPAQQILHLPGPSKTCADSFFGWSKQPTCVLTKLTVSSHLS